MENTSSTQKLPLISLSDGILIAILSVIAYCYAFCYERAFVITIGIPQEFMAVTLERIILFLAYISGIIGSLFLLLNTLALFWPKHYAIQIKLLRLSFIALPFLWKIMLYRHLQKDWIPFLVCLVVVGLLEFAHPAIAFRKEGNYFRRLEADETAEAPVRAKTLIGRISLRLGMPAYLIIIGMIYFAWLAHDAGRSEALTKEKYPVTTEPPNIIILRAYPDRFICAPIDRETSLVKQEFSVWPTESLKTLHFSTETVGPLRFKDKQTTTDQTQDANRPNKGMNKK